MEHAAKDMAEYLEQDIVGLILQYLQERGFHESAHKLEKESQYYFDFDHFESLFVEAKWEAVLSYISGFIQNKNEHQLLYFEILKQKFLDFLDRADKASARQTLLTEIAPFFGVNDAVLASEPTSRRVQLYNEFLALFHSDDFRTHQNLMWMENGRETRAYIFQNIRNYLIEKVPKIRERCQPVNIPQPGRLRHIINQSLNWQMLLQEQQTLSQTANCAPVLQTLFADHNLFNNETVDIGNFSFRNKHKQQVTLEDSRPNTDGQITIKLEHEEPMIIEERPQKQYDQKPSHYTSEIKSDRSTTKRPATQKNSTAKRKKGGPIEHNEPEPAGAKSSTDWTVVFDENGSPTCVAIHPHEPLLAAGTQHGTVSLWSAASQAVLYIVAPLQPSKIKKMAWSPDGAYLGVLFEHQPYVTVYQLSESKLSILQERIQIHSAAISCFCFFLYQGAESGCRRLCILTGSADMTVKAYDLFDPTFCFSFDAHSSPVVDAAHLYCSGTLIYFASVSVDGAVKIWVVDGNDTQNKSILKHTSLDSKSTVVRLISCAGRLVTCGRTSDSLAQWNNTSGKISHVFPFNLNSPVNLGNMTMCFKASTLQMSVGSTLRSWDLNTAALVYQNSYPAEIFSFDTTNHLLAIIFKSTTNNGKNELKVSYLEPISKESPFMVDQGLNSPASRFSDGPSMMSSSPSQRGAGQGGQQDGSGGGGAGGFGNSPKVNGRSAQGGPPQNMFQQPPNRFPPSIQPAYLQFSHDDYMQQQNYGRPPSNFGSGFAQPPYFLHGQQKQPPVSGPPRGSVFQNPPPVQAPNKFSQQGGGPSLQPPSNQQPPQSPSVNPTGSSPQAGSPLQNTGTPSQNVGLHQQQNVQQHPGVTGQPPSTSQSKSPPQPGPPRDLQPLSNQGGSFPPQFSSPALPQGLPQSLPPHVVESRQSFSSQNRGEAMSQQQYQQQQQPSLHSPHPNVSHSPQQSSHLSPQNQMPMKLNQQQQFHYSDNPGVQQHSEMGRPQPQHPDQTGAKSEAFVHQVLAEEDHFQEDTDMPPQNNPMFGQNTFQEQHYPPQINQNPGFHPNQNFENPQFHQPMNPNEGMGYYQSEQDFQPQYQNAPIPQFLPLGGFPGNNSSHQ